MKYLHLCMLMYVEMDLKFGAGADIFALLVYVYLTNCFCSYSIFTLSLHKIVSVYSFYKNHYKFLYNQLTARALQRYIGPRL